MNIEHRSNTFWDILATDKQKNTQTEKHTNRKTHKQKNRKTDEQK